MNIGCRWPKLIYFEVRDGDSNLLDCKFARIYSWNEVMTIGEAFAQEVMAVAPIEDNLDECYWHYVEVE